MTLQQQIEALKEKYAAEVRMIKSKSDRSNAATLQIMLDGQAGILARVLDDLNRLSANPTCTPEADSE